MLMFWVHASINYDVMYIVQMCRVQNSVKIGLPECMAKAMLVVFSIVIMLAL